MPADVQQIIKSSRSTSAQNRKSAVAPAREDFGRLLRQANQPRPRPSDAAEDSSGSAPAKSAKSAKSARSSRSEKQPDTRPIRESDESPIEQDSAQPVSADATASNDPPVTDQSAESPQGDENSSSADHSNEHHDPAVETLLIAAQAAQTQPVASQSPQASDTHAEQSADSPATAVVMAVGNRHPSPVAAEGATDGKGQAIPVAMPADTAQDATPADQPAADPDKQAKDRPALQLKESLNTPSNRSDAPSADQHKAQQTNSPPNTSSNAVPTDLPAAQPTAMMTDPDHPAANKPEPVSRLDLVLSPLGDSSAPRQSPATTNASIAAAPMPPEAQFAQDNHDKIVTSLRSQITGSNTTMHIRLDPPELGALQVTVRMRDGIMSAAFETSSDQATQLLSHTLGQLKQVLESQGVSIDKLHVQQSARPDKPATGDEHNHQQHTQDGHSARQEQQRRETIRRMWRRLGVGGDPLDLVA